MRKEEKAGGYSTELQKPNVEVEVHNNNKKRDWEKEKKNSNT